MQLLHPLNLQMKCRSSALAVRCHTSGVILLAIPATEGRPSFGNAMNEVTGGCKLEDLVVINDMTKITVLLRLYN